mgnify:CR=1 FL=1
MNGKFLVYILIIASFWSCESGHEIYIEPESETLFADELMYPDSLLVSQHFNDQNDTFSVFSSTGQVYLYYASVTKARYYLEDYDSTYPYTKISTAIRTDDLAPRISGSLSFRLYKGVHQPLMSLNIGSLSTYTVTSDMTAINSNETDNRVSFHTELAAMDTVYQNVYLIENNNPTENQIKGIVYSMKNGILGFYRNEKTYWIIR